jgi:predicted Zn-dependent protease
MRKLVFLVVLLAGCSQNPIKEHWVPNEQVWETATRNGLSLRDRRGAHHKHIPASQVRNLMIAREKLRNVSGVEAYLVIVETDLPNAFAWTYQGNNFIAFSISYLEQLGNDRDAIATTMGHEMAHLHLKHTENRGKREEVKRGASMAVGYILGAAGVPFLGSYAAEVGTHAVFNSFTRDEERDADDLGLKWTLDAGFDPCGHARVVQALGKDKTDIPFLSTHPGSLERATTANDFSLKVRGMACS